MPVVVPTKKRESKPQKRRVRLSPIRHRPVTPYRMQLLFRLC
nr:MAG TPA: hypothetical protein [Bacteriophage sp.]